MKGRIIISIFSLIFLILGVISFIKALYLQGALALITIALLIAYQVFKERDKKAKRGNNENDEEDI